MGAGICGGVEQNGGGRSQDLHYQAATGLDWPNFLAQFGLALAAGCGLLWALNQPVEGHHCPSLPEGPRGLADAPHTTPNFGQQQQANDDLALRRTLLIKCLWDEMVVERLIGYERERNPRGSVRDWLVAAIERWDHDNR